MGKGGNSDVVFGRALLRGNSLYSLAQELEMYVLEMIEYIIQILPYSKTDLIAMPEEHFFITVDRAKEAYRRQSNNYGRGNRV